MTVLGRRIAQARRERGLTQEALAERVGVSQTSIVRIEKGHTSPSVPNLIAIADTLGLSLDDLVWGVYERPKATDLIRPQDGRTG